MHGLQPILGVFKSQDMRRLYVFHPLPEHSLADVLRFCPKALGDLLSLRLVVFQLLQAVQALHSTGVMHGSISPANVFVSTDR